MGTCLCQQWTVTGCQAEVVKGTYQENGSRRSRGQKQKFSLFFMERRHPEGVMDSRPKGRMGTRESEEAAPQTASNPRLRGVDWVMWAMGRCGRLLRAG